MDKKVKNSKTNKKNKGVQEIGELGEDDFSDMFIVQSGSRSNHQANEEDLNGFFDISSDMVVDDPTINH